jgi:hypothetical protein
MAPKTKIILLISCCLNAVLAAAWFVNRSTDQGIIKVEPATNTVTAAASKKLSGERTRTLTVMRDKNLDWSTVESEDYREYIANLRAIGCPEETVRDIIIADINKLYASKIAALYPAPKDIKFWRVQNSVARNEERERDKKRHELDQEKHALIKELLGIDYDAELARLSGRPTDDEMRYGFLSPEKQEQAKALREKYREMERDVFKDGGFTPENRAKYMAVRAEQESEMAKLLGPEDFEQYELRNSRTARTMRESLGGFEPSEDEFRQIFDARKSYDDQFAFTRDGSDQAVNDDKKTAQAKLEEQLKSVLGEDRYHDYQMSQDDRYKESYDFAQNNNLPKEKAEALYDVRLAAEKEMKRIQRDSSLSADARNAALQGIAADTTTALGTALGPDVLQKYVTSGSAGWMTSGTSSDRNRRDRGNRGDRGSRRGS